MTVAFKNKQPIIVSPAALRRAGFKSRQQLEVKVRGGSITILPKTTKLVDEPIPSERRAVRRGIVLSEKDYEQGRSYGPFDTHEAFVASLHAETAKLDKKSKRPAK